LTVIVVSFFESVVRDHSKDHPMTVAHISNDTLTGIRTPLWRTPLSCHADRSGVFPTMVGHVARRSVDLAVEGARVGVSWWTSAKRLGFKRIWPSLPTWPG
jgi:hypothetical protein